MLQAISIENVYIKLASVIQDKITSHLKRYWSSWPFNLNRFTPFCSKCTSLHCECSLEEILQTMIDQSYAILIVTIWRLWVQIKSDIDNHLAMIWRFPIFIVFSKTARQQMQNVYMKYDLTIWKQLIFRLTTSPTINVFV